MSKVHPLLRVVPAPATTTQAQKRPFSVRVHIGVKYRELNVLAASSCDAVVSAIDALFDGEEPVPDGFAIYVSPIDSLPRVA